MEVKSCHGSGSDLCGFSSGGVRVIFGMTKPLRMTGSFEAAEADMELLRDKPDPVEEKDEDRLTPAILDEYVWGS